MSSKFSNELNNAKGKWKVATVKDTVDYSKDEFFIKKAEKANEILSKSKKVLPNGMILRRIEQ
ncbi:hypothetical protein [Paraflavitalea speifideaquila]|uniref:hypothetical protein n=1 Tax=Paraflavitalea speifideaquila TaxID=3076558 RepID=UPI0028ECB4BA|nr:hypothetical protein [Paraflavitalea speifideiaquila]